MRMLHVSDLHVSPRDAIDRRAVIASFLRDVVAQNRDQQVEAVVVSGDIAFSGQAEEYRLAEEQFLDPLLELLSITRDRVVLAPGNHDINRDSIDPFTEAGLRQELQTR